MKTLVLSMMMVSSLCLAADKDKLIAVCDAATTNGACTEFSKFEGTDEAQEKATCSAIKGTWKTEGRCPTAKLSGICTKPNGQVWRWYDAGFMAGTKADTLTKYCDQEKGKFSKP